MGLRGWISKDVILPPCPICKRIYKGIEKRDHRGVTLILAKQIKKRKWYNPISWIKY